MTANAGTIHGNDMILSYNSGTVLVPVWTPIAHATSNGIKHPTSMREIASKTAGKNTNVRPGKHGLSSLSVSGLATYDGANYYTLKGLRDSFSRIQFKISGRPTGDTGYVEVLEAVGDKYEEGYGYIASLSKDDPHDNNSTFSVEITIDGATEIKTVAGGA